MIRVTEELCRWLRRHNLPTEGVELRLTLPNACATHHAIAAVEREITPLLIGAIDPVAGGLQMNGINVRFSTGRRSG